MSGYFSAIYKIKAADEFTDVIITVVVINTNSNNNKPLP